MPVPGILSKLGSSVTGPAGLHSCLPKSCNVALSWPFFFNYLFYLKSLDGLLPSLWKAYIIGPLFKNGFRYNPFNYLPVNLTLVCCK